jgi:hypothetical protein
VHAADVPADVLIDDPADEFDVATTRTQLSQLQRGTERGRQAAAESGPAHSPAWPREDEESRQR